MKANLTRGTGNAFYPDTEEDLTKLRRIKEGDTIEINYRKMRNPRFHRKFFSMLNFAVDNMPQEMMYRFGDVEKLRRELMLQTGRFDIHVTLGNREIFMPHSIAFDKMEPDEFEKLYSESMDIILKYFVRGARQEDLLQYDR